jgi:hypothetical protein
MTLSECKAGLKSGMLVLQLSTWGDGMMGVGLYRKGAHTPIERICIAPWHVDQDDEEMIFADRNEAPGWFYNIFHAGELSNKAREFCTDYCLDHTDEITAYFDGEYETVLPVPVIE